MFYKKEIRLRVEGGLVRVRHVNDCFYDEQINKIFLYLITQYIYIRRGETGSAPSHYHASTSTASHKGPVFRHGTMFLF
jgi:hypothetical protein